MILIEKRIILYIYFCINSILKIMNKKFNKHYSLESAEMGYIRHHLNINLSKWNNREEDERSK